ncbi:MAG: hypothetical protein C5B48_05605 [Candidatus Rokuibacteriota bacterium]|nr:MAG: hypothetical protein C5B48_05605 [Candidatus Rokubacteria bacterium]
MSAAVRSRLQALFHLRSAWSTRRKLFAWGLVDQSFSSATTLVFTILAARNLGPSGLGTVSVGYAAFLVALGIERSLVLDPLRARISDAEISPRQALSGAFSVALLAGLLVSLLALAVGLSASGPTAQGLLIFAPWFVPGLLQALLRAWLYREGRGRAATTSGVVWLMVMLVVAGAGLRSSPWEVTAAWGLGSCAALVVAALATDDLGVARPLAAAAWFRNEAASLGGWLTGSSILFSAAMYVQVAGITSILGTAAVGGLRAIQTAFAPASLVGPALGNPGLPTMRDAVERDASDAWRLAVRLSALSFGLVFGYVIVVVVGKNLVFRIFGEDFRQYQYLILPIAVAQLLGSLGVGPSILLLGARMMRKTATVYALHGLLLLAVSLPLAAVSGLEAAAWGLAFVEIPLLLLVVFYARRAVGPGAA